MTVEELAKWKADKAFNRRVDYLLGYFTSKKNTGFTKAFRLLDMGPQDLLDSIWFKIADAPGGRTGAYYISCGRNRLLDLLRHAVSVKRKRRREEMKVFRAERPRKVGKGNLIIPEPITNPVWINTLSLINRGGQPVFIKSMKKPGFVSPGGARPEFGKIKAQRENNDMEDIDRRPKVGKGCPGRRCIYFGRTSGRCCSDLRCKFTSSV
jgi:hypothetical protein